MFRPELRLQIIFFKTNAEFDFLCIAAGFLRAMIILFQNVDVYNCSLTVVGNTGVFGNVTCNLVEIFITVASTKTSF